MTKKTEQVSRPPFVFNPYDLEDAINKGGMTFRIYNPPMAKDLNPHDLEEENAEEKEQNTQIIYDEPVEAEDVDPSEEE